MSVHDRSRRPANSVALADDNLLESDEATVEDQQFAAMLATGLGGLRTARPGFRDGLERRLLSGQAQPAVQDRAWWRRGPLTRPIARRRADGLARLPRRSLLGLAAGV